MERKVLGRGLGALITTESESAEENILQLHPDRIVVNRYQPRRHFSPESLQELIASIREKGVLQPIVVRSQPDGMYELIAGERRLRAVKALGFIEIPAIIKQASDQEMLEWAIIENVQRSDLNPLEEAKAYAMLLQDFGFTQEQVAKTVGKNRVTVANTLRILALPESVQQALAELRISLGHAKAILSLAGEAEQRKLLDSILADGLSVRETERRVQNGGAEPPAPTGLRRVSSPESGPSVAPHTRQVQEQLQHRLGTKVSIQHRKKDRGTIHIDYYSLEDLQRLVELIGGS